ncbi:hypothetical protein SAMN04487819_11518 [Actinopolyspora alba]|uniref:Uncharacterized protein n=1 Tax=Actinopolyspora alba TaxID=673379 RepID=A0A1I2B446_9ACTN|nr:hypothetical protein [Actinopolyspora alba]SFE49940.1 hypothetical protein SAMN04487819_11518 [Actinopolyspora alba]
MTTSELQALACPDCPASITSQRSTGAEGPILVVGVEHAGTCPWAAAYVPAEGYVLAVAGGLLLHTID